MLIKTKDEALKMAIEQLWACSMLMNLDHSDYLYEDVIQALDACKEALDTEQVRECSNHPDAPHGFCRDASHTADRYVCECEGWQPAQEPVTWLNKMQSITEQEYSERS